MHQFMIYHFYEWDVDKAKWKKKPVGLDGSPLMLGAGIPTSSDRAAVAATVARLGESYHLGLYIQPPLFFLDLDDDAVDAHGQLSPLAAEMAGPLVAAGCYFEGSSSGRGAHVVGTFTGPMPPHASNVRSMHRHEFFSRDRGCVLSAGATSGSWDVDATQQVLQLLARHFPPRLVVAGHALQDGPRAEWRGPADDDALVRRMLSATGSALSRMQGKVSLGQLWAGECEHDSESDMALAAHLAFWTGADAARCERLMLRSGLKRDKWFEGRRDSTYLRVTVDNACMSTTTVYQEPARVDTAAALLGAATGPLPPVALAPLTAVIADWHQLVDQLCEQINGTGTRKELLDVVMPSLGTHGLPKLYGDVVSHCLVAKAKIFDIKMSIADARRVVMPPMVADALLQQVVPEWAEPIVYVLKSDKFYDTASGSEYSHEGLRMQFSRYMPARATANGGKEDPVAWLRERWNIPNVDDIAYRPDQEPLFQHAGRQYANTFRASTMPTPVVGSDECSQCVQLFTQHLADLTGRRADVYAAVLGWIAHNVQYPGHKIRWAPLIKGVGGDGKSMIGDLLFAAMGRANVKLTSPSTLSNSGGFTDWAVGACVNVIEEIRLEGKERRKLYNAMKTIIGDHNFDPNKKGKASEATMVNVTNHMALTNHEDATPLDNTDRRWGIIFAPWSDANQAARVKGLGSSDDLPAYFKRLGASMKAEPGAWRAWLMSIDLSSFAADGRAPVTDERQAMMNSSEDYIEQTVRDTIALGGSGVDIEAFCSWSLMRKVELALDDKPDKRTWNRILTDLGYRQVKPMWWSGKTRRVWVKTMMNHDKIVEILNETAVVRPLVIS